MGKGTVAIHEDIAAFLASHADEGYRAFQAKLIPNIDAATIVGVRTPELRKFAKGLARREDAGEFLAALPHGAFEENQLHSFVIAQERDFGKLVGEIERHHEERYRALLRNVETAKVFEKSEVKVWECRNCGHIVVGTKAPDVCPTCNHPQSYFEVHAENY